MKKSELKRLIARYQEIQVKIKKSHNEKLKKELEEIQHRYFHEEWALYPDVAAAWIPPFV